VEYRFDANIILLKMSKQREFTESPIMCDKSYENQSTLYYIPLLIIFV
jgi:hypothetical protein